MKSVYPILIGEMAKRDIKKTTIAAHIGISERCLYNKLYGVSAFTWPEVCEITEKFFPDMNKDVLFSRSDSDARETE